MGVAGAFFPGWMAAVLLGAGLTAAMRYLFVATRLEPHIGPPAVIYAGLGLLLITVSWLVLYRS
ncbi:MAG TPA: YtcA family lipoprotein [Kofleriaceae bacterium]|nr:YtcA family lipoprotein [Kofleriaceae bacterium]